MVSIHFLVGTALFSIAAAQKVSNTGRCGASYGLTCVGSSFGKCCSSNGWWYVHILYTFLMHANLVPVDLLVITVVKDVKLASGHAGPTRQYLRQNPPPSLYQRMNAAARNTKVRRAKEVRLAIAALSTGKILSSNMHPECSLTSP